MVAWIGLSNNTITKRYIDVKKYKVQIRLFVAVIICTSIIGCVSPRAVLVSEDGRRVTCQASGFGIISGTLANNRYEECVSNAQMNGFVMESSAGQFKKENKSQHNNLVSTVPGKQEPNSVIKLRYLHQLKEEGIITDKEYDAQKAKLLQNEEWFE